MRAPRPIACEWEEERRAATGEEVREKDEVVAEACGGLGSRREEEASSEWRGGWRSLARFQVLLLVPHPTSSISAYGGRDWRFSTPPPPRFSYYECPATARRWSLEAGVVIVGLLCLNPLIWGGLNPGPFSLSICGLFLGAGAVFNVGYDRSSQCRSGASKEVSLLMSEFMTCLISSFGHLPLGSICASLLP
jgi:hypothetical protein